MPSDADVSIGNRGSLRKLGAKAWEPKQLHMRIMPMDNIGAYHALMHIVSQIHGYGHVFGHGHGDGRGHGIGHGNGYGHGDVSMADLLHDIPD